MKIESIYIRDIGPFEEREINFRDEWSGNISPRVLFSGPNGCGKTTLLNCISYLWQALGFWLYEKKELPKTSEIKKFLGTRGCCGMIINGIPDFSTKENKTTKRILVFIGDYEYFLKIKTRRLITSL